MENSESKIDVSLKVLGLDRETYNFATAPQLVDYILADMEKRIKHDIPVKLSVFFTALSGYLKEPINLFLKGESGVGKSYNTVQTLKYFPHDDIWFLGGLSPKALVHDYGKLLTEDGKPAETLVPPERPRKSDYPDREEYADAIKLWKSRMREYIDELRRTYTLIELGHRILVFLESPEFEAFRMLYPILSHDTERIEYRFVDRPSKGRMRTMRVVIQGFPATIFLTVDRKYMEELATRSFTATPESKKEKISEANKYTNYRANYPWENMETEVMVKTRKLIGAIRDWFKSSDVDVVIPFEDLYELFPKEIARDMRDFQHFVQFVKTITALHTFQRPFIELKGRPYLVSSLYDVMLAACIYTEIFETTRTGTERALLDFYHNVVKLKTAWYLKDLTEKYNAYSPRKASSETIRKKMERLAEIGYVTIEKDEADKRLNVYKPLIKNEEELSTIPLKTISWLDLKLKLEEGFKKWQKKIHKIGDFQIKKFFSGSITMKELEEMVMEEKIFSFSSLPFCGYLFKDKESPKNEKEKGETRIGDSCQFVDISKVKSLVQLTTHIEDKCVSCGKTGKMDFQVDLIDGSWGLLCEDCGRKLQEQLRGVE